MIRKSRIMGVKMVLDMILFAKSQPPYRDLGSQWRLTQVAEELNNRSRKSFGFRTPAEMVAQQIRQLNSGVA